MAPPGADGEALWAQVAATVRPLKGRRGLRSAALATTAAPPPPPASPERLPFPPAAAAPSRSKGPGETLDGGWDRRLRRGLVAPDYSLDLHGHTLASAHAALETGLARARAVNARLLLIVTGRPPRLDDERRDGRPARGAIRAAIGDWLACSPHASAIAAVRGAHPRHGGAGALYVVLRRASRA